MDFIAWDIRAALQMAKEFFKDSDIPWASFHTFRREAGTVNLKTPSEEEPDDEDQAPELDETLAGMDYIPYTPQNEEEYFQQRSHFSPVACAAATPRPSTALAAPPSPLTSST